MGNISCNIRPQNLFLHKHGQQASIHWPVKRKKSSFKVCMCMIWLPARMQHLSSSGWMFKLGWCSLTCKAFYNLKWTKKGKEEAVLTSAFSQGLHHVQHAARMLEKLAWSWEVEKAALYLVKVGCAHIDFAFLRISLLAEEWSLDAWCLKWRTLQLCNLHHPPILIS